MKEGYIPRDQRKKILLLIVKYVINSIIKKFGLLYSMCKI